MNNWTIAGNVGKDAVLRHTPQGDPVLNFSVGVTERKGQENVTLWVDCSLWGKRAESLEPYISKGSKVAVSGQAGVRVHEGKAHMTMRVAEVTLQGSKQDGERRESEQRKRTINELRQSQPSAAGSDFPEDSIPF
jgi:single-strand DNA-binding protein